VPVSLDVVQHEDRACGGRERRHGALEVDPRLDVAPRRGRGGVDDLVAGERHAGETAAVRSGALEQRRHGDAPQPRRDRRLAAERRQPLPRPHEHVLRELRRAGAVARQPQREPVDAPRLAPVQRLERLRAPGARPGDERPLRAVGRALGAGPRRQVRRDAIWRNGHGGWRGQNGG
jgi:hypothetical protein